MSLGPFRGVRGQPGVRSPCLTHETDRVSSGLKEHEAFPRAGDPKCVTLQANSRTKCLLQGFNFIKNLLSVIQNPEGEIGALCVTGQLVILYRASTGSRVTQRGSVHGPAWLF